MAAEADGAEADGEAVDGEAVAGEVADGAADMAMARARVRGGMVTARAPGVTAMAGDPGPGVGGIVNGVGVDGEAAAVGGRAGDAEPRHRLRQIGRRRRSAEMPVANQKGSCKLLM